jgi:glycosyltransferase involved in cell wall biosynthesis
LNTLILGLGDSGWEDPAGESVLRHQEYARRAGGNIDLIIDSPRAAVYRHGGLTVYLTGVPRSQYVFAAQNLARQLARRQVPDVIAAQDPFGTALAGWLIRNEIRRPLLIQNHSSFLFNRYWLAERPFLFRMLHVVARFILPKADGWRVVNAEEKKIYTDRLNLPADRIRILPVPCDLQPFLAADLPRRAEKFRQITNVPEKVPLAVWAGRPVRVKQLPVLLDAFSRLLGEFPEAHLLLAGERRLAQEDLSRAEARIADRCRWIGAMTRPALAEAYAAADIFLMSSAYEGFGRVLVEAGAAGLPAVSTATAGAREIIRDGETGFLVPVGDSSLMADRTAHLWKDENQRGRMGRSARSHVLSKFDPEKAFDGIVAQWRDIAAGGLSH